MNAKIERQKNVFARACRWYESSVVHGRSISCQNFNKAKLAQAWQWLTDVHDEEGVPRPEPCKDVV